MPDSLPRSSGDPVALRTYPAPGGAPPARAGGDGAASKLPARTTGPALGATTPVPADHILPAHRNKAERVSDHLAGISTDLREWVELRIQLARAQVEALIDTRVVALRGQLVFGVAAGIAGFYFLVTLAVCIGALLGGRYWIGFLSVNVLLAGAAWWAKRKFAPGKMRVERSKATGTLKISHDQTPAQKEAEQKGEPIPHHGKLHA